MAETLFVYAAALLVFGVAGSAFLLLLRPADPRLGSGAIPFGACVLIVLAYWPGIFLTGQTIAYLLLAIVAIAVVAAVVRARGRVRVREIATRADGLIVAIPVLVGFVALVPLFSIGFATTISIDIADGWARSILVEWLAEHALTDSETLTGAANPAGTYSAMDPALGAGFEYLGVLLKTITARDAYQVVLPLGATAIPIAACGWIRLWEELAGRRPAGWQVLVIALGALSPVVVVAYAETYLTQMFSLALWPFAVAAALAFYRAPAVRTAVVAAIAIGAVAGTYPPLGPWLAPVVLALAVFSAARGEGSTLVRRLRGAVFALVLLGLAILVVAPHELLRATGAVDTIGGLRSNAGFPLIRLRHAISLVLGGLTQFTTPPQGRFPPEPQYVFGLVVLYGSVLVAAIGALRWRGARWPLAVVVGGVVAVTGAVFFKYKIGDEYGYGAYKALLYGGSLLTGLLVLALAMPGNRMLALRAVAVGAVLVLWLPTTIDLLQRQRNGLYGFREADHALGKELAKLPAGSTVLVEGAAETSTSFRLQMAATYFGVANDLSMRNVGATFYYGSGGPRESTRPTTPWTHVVSSGPSTPFDEERRTLWEEEPFRLQAAPPLDITPFGLSRQGADPAVPGAARFWIASPGNEPEPTSYIAGPVDFVVANRTDQPQTARVTLDLINITKQRRTVRLKVDGQEVAPKVIRGQKPRSIQIDVPVAPNSTGLLQLDAGRLTAPPEAALPPVLALTGVRVEPR